ncbi:MAG: peptidoglycan-binding domain-containing protein [Archangium sp.]
MPSVSSVRSASLAATGSSPTLRQGSSGNSVRDLQNALRAAGHNISVDGQFGPQTKAAVIAFQRARGLTVDGIVGPQTWGALRAAPMPTLKQGATGAAVRDLQSKLVAKGLGIGVDGVFGPQTRNAVIAFQRANGLTVDGIVGPQTWGRLNSGGSAPVNNGGGVNGKQSLADAARNVALSMGGYNSQGLCATGVSRAIRQIYGFTVWGNGNDIDNNLPRDKFRQVNISLAEALKIPGLILTWEKTSTRAGSIYGHTAITLGDGRSSASDFIEGNTLAAEGGRQGLKIFMPI